MSAAPRPATLLLTGGTGQLGWELRRALAPLGRVVAPGRAELDLTSAASLRRAMREIRPAAVINAAAYTAVDRAEEERDAAFALNAAAPQVLAEESARLGALLLHFSTDYVFDGRGSRPLTEQDAPGPLNVYGESKLAGERAIQAVGGAHLILRTSWIFGLRGHNFVRTILRLAHQEEELRVVDDQIGTPTWSRLLAAATGQLLARLAGDGRFDLPESARGVHHLAGGGEVSWHGFARAILDLDPRRDRQRCRSLRAVSSEEFGARTRRPAYSVLSCSRAAHAFQLRLPEWREQLSLAMEGAAEPGLDGVVPGRIPAEAR